MDREYCKDPRCTAGFTHYASEGHTAVLDAVQLIMEARPPWEVITETENKMRREKKARTAQGRRDYWMEWLMVTIVILTLMGTAFAVILELRA